MVGVAELVAGAALGTLFGKLINGVEKLLVNKPTQLHTPPLLSNINSTLISLHPLITQIERRNTQLNLSNKQVADFKRVIYNGVELVNKLSKTRNWWENTSCMRQLEELDRSLRRQTEMLTAEGVRDGKEVLVLARRILVSVWNMQTAFKEMHESWMVVMFVMSFASLSFMFVASWSVVGVTSSSVWLVFKMFWTLFRVVVKLVGVVCNIAMVPLG